MGHTRRFRSTVPSLVVVVAVGTASCDGRRTKPGAPATSSSVRTHASVAGPSTPPSASQRRHEPLEPTVVPEARADGGLPGLAFRELSDVGPAGPAAATEEGVVMLTKGDRLALARSSKGPVRKGKIGSVTEPAGEFKVLGRAPSVAGGFAHWVSRGRLVRHRADGSGELETLADDARDGARVAAVTTKGGVAVAYLRRADAEGTSHVKLWLGPGRTFDLTPDGAGASSVALAPLDGRLVAISIDGRSAMTPLHARTVSVDGPGPPELGPDVVVWVAGPAHSFTEVTAGSDGSSAWALLPIERDAMHFGLATVPLGSDPKMDAVVSFLDYPNGIDLAPVAAAKLCEKLYVALARPSAAAPRSPQELVITAVGGGETAVLANAAGFAAVSLAAAPGGGLVAYVADGRTWARGLECL